MKNKLTIDKNISRLLIILIAELILFSITKGSDFLKPNTFTTMGTLFPEYGVLALGMALALYIGGIDLSIVYIANLSAIMISKIMLAKLTTTSTMGQAAPILLLCVLVAVLIGTVCGVLNGLLIAGVGIPPILATLGTQSLFLGISVVITGGSTISKLPQNLAKIIKIKVIGIPLSAVIFIIAAIVVYFIMSKTRFGYSLRMLGTNSKATTFSGLNNLNLTIRNYIIIDVLGALSGILMTGRLSSAKADNGSTYTMQVILIAVMGGIDPNGGKGNIIGVAIAVIIIQMISTWLTMFQNISVFYRQIIWGAMLLFVLIYNHMNNEMEKKKAVKK